MNVIMRRYIKLIVIISTFAFISCEKDDEVLVQGVAVDLGLSVKWANCNVGASTPEEYGDYFAWGEVHPKTILIPMGWIRKPFPLMLMPLP